MEREDFEQKLSEWLDRPHCDKLRAMIDRAVAQTPRLRPIRADWQRLPETGPPVNAFRAQWEGFLRHVAEEAPWRHGLEEGAKGVQLAECALESWAERRFVDISPLEI